MGLSPQEALPGHSGRVRRPPGPVSTSPVRAHLGEKACPPPPLVAAPRLCPWSQGPFQFFSLSCLHCRPHTPPPRAPCAQATAGGPPGPLPHLGPIPPTASVTALMLNGPVTHTPSLPPARLGSASSLAPHPTAVSSLSPAPAPPPQHRSLAGGGASCPPPRAASLFSVARGSQAVGGEVCCSSRTLSGQDSEPITEGMKNQGLSRS